jgi:endoglucanase
MLLAEVTGDNAAFGRIWRWTQAHLQRADGLFAFHANAAGHVLDAQPASDADLLIAWALLRYHGPGAAACHAAGRRVADAVLAHEVITGPRGEPVLTAGPWATGNPASLNPSYWSLVAMRALASLTGNMRWRQMATGAVSLTRELTRAGKLLPPDWAELTAGGQLRPGPAPGGNVPQPQYGLDAQRTVVWFAASCEAGERELAARWWPKLRGSGQSQAIAMRLDGKVINEAAAPLPLVAAAAAARAAGDTSASAHLLHQAVQQQRSYPTYYGAGWAALGPAFLHGPLARC